MKDILNKETLKTLIFSENSDNINLQNYLFPHISKPDKGSEFDQKLGTTKYLLKVPYLGKNYIYPKLLTEMLNQGYDALFLKYKNIVGFAAYQLKMDKYFHEPSANLFRVWIDPKYRQNGFGLQLVESLMEYCSNIGIPLINVGNQGDDAINKIAEKITQKKYSFKQNRLSGNLFTLN